MTLAQYLFLDENPLTLRFGDFYYYQNGGDNILLNLKTKEKQINIELNDKDSLSQQLKIPLIINEMAVFVFYTFNIIRDNGHILYSERIEPLFDSERIIKLNTYKIMWGRNLVVIDGIKTFKDTDGKMVNSQDFDVYNLLGQKMFLS